jgi:hypothetical protein
VVYRDEARNGRPVVRCLGCAQQRVAQANAELQAKDPSLTEPRVRRFLDLWGYGNNVEHLERILGHDFAALRNAACELFGHAEWTPATLRRLRSWLEATHPADTDVFGLSVSAVAAKLLAAQPAPPGGWSRTNTVGHWARVFDVGRNTMAGMLKNNVVRNKRLGAKSYQIAVADLPAPEPGKRPVPGKGC